MDFNKVQEEDENFLFELYSTTREDLLSLGWGLQETQNLLRMQFQAQRHSYHTQYPEADHRLIMWEENRAGQFMVNRTEQEIVLVDISLLPTHRNRGIGTKVLENLQREAAQYAKLLRLQVLHSNHARRLYHRLGFQVIDNHGPYQSMVWKSNISY